MTSFTTTTLSCILMRLCWRTASGLLTVPWENPHPSLHDSIMAVVQLQTGLCVLVLTLHICVNLISLVRENEQHKGGDKEGGEIWQCLPLFCVAAEHKNIRDVKAELVNISESHLGHFNTTRNVCVLCLNVCKNRVSLPSDSTDGAEQECMKTRSICQSEWKMWPSAPSVLGQRRQ